MARDLHEIAYETAIRALDQQERRLEELRTRAGTLLAASSLALTLLSPTATGNTRPGLLTVTALIAFLACVGTSLYVLIPRHDLALSPSARSFQDRLDPRDTSAAYRRLTQELQGYQRRNELAARRLTEFSQAAGVFLAIETVLLVILRTRGII